MLPNAAPWWITVVYGSQLGKDKVAFLDELLGIRSHRVGPWLLCGDFNLIYQVINKNNHRLNHHLMHSFRAFLQDLDLTKFHLHGRLYTWSNEHAHPTLERIDRAFACLQWGDIFPHRRL
jgi:hypothetical protein